MTCLFHRVSRNFDNRRQTGAGILDVAKDFETPTAKELPYKLTVLYFSKYMVKILPEIPNFQTTFQSTTSSRRALRAGLARLPYAVQPICE